jgi:hypothetical protein
MRRSHRLGDAPQQKRIIFDPIPRVDGIEPSEDPLLELRAAIYLLSGRRQAPESQSRLRRRVDFATRHD